MDTNFTELLIYPSLSLLLCSYIIWCCKKYYIHSPYISLDKALQQFEKKTNYCNEPGTEEWMENGRSNTELCFKHFECLILTDELDLYTYDSVRKTYEPCYFVTKQNLSKYEFLDKKGLVEKNSETPYPQPYLKKKDLEKIISQYIKNPYADINPYSKKS